VTRVERCCFHFNGCRFLVISPIPRAFSIGVRGPDRLPNNHSDPEANRKSFDGMPVRDILANAAPSARPFLPVSLRAILAVALLSIRSDIIRHRERLVMADHAVRQRFTDFLPDSLLFLSRLISVRSGVSLWVSFSRQSAM